MTRETCRFEIDLEFEGGSAAASTDPAALRPMIIALVHEHGLGPATYDSPEGELDRTRFPIGPRLYTGTWWGYPADVYLSGTLRTFGVRLRWTVPLPAPPLVEPIAAFVHAVVRALGPDGRFGWHSHLIARDMVRRSPPLDYRTPWGAGSILDLVGEEFAAASPIAQQQVPPPAWREVRDGVHVIRWAREPLTGEEIQRAAFAQEDWLRASPEREMASRDEWNARGDRRIAYPDEDTIEELDVRWDGTPRDPDRLAELLARTTPTIIVCPSRRAAIALSQHVGSGHVITYRSRESLWEPAPPGYVHHVPLVEPHLTLDVLLHLPDLPSDEVTALLRTLVALAIEHGVAAPGSYLDADVAPGVRLGPDALTWPQPTITVRGPQANDPTIEVSGRGTEVLARVRWPWVDGMRVIGGVAAFIPALRARLPAGGMIIDNSLTPVGFELASLRPARSPGRWAFGALLDLVDGQVQAWAHDPLTQDELQRAWLEQQRWAAVDGRSFVSAGWNDAGDRQLAIADLVVLPPLTLYDEDTGEGYKALAVEDDGHTSERALAELVALRDAGRLPDDRPLTSIVVMTTSRAGAVALAPRARERGLRVAYLTEDHQLWEVP